MDPDHPRISMNLFRKFKSYVNMESVKAKLECYWTQQTTRLLETIMTRLAAIDKNRITADFFDWLC
jgi:hypothetical protein